MNVFTTAEMKNYEEFLKVYRDGDECLKDYGRELIFYAVENTNQEERYKITGFLLSKGARTDVVSPNGYNLLHILLFKGPHEKKDLPKTIELCKAFIAGGASVNQIGKLGETPLNALMNLRKFSDEELAPLYDLFEAQGDLLVTHKNAWGYSAIDLARKDPMRQALVKRLEKYERSSEIADMEIEKAACSKTKSRKKKTNK